MDAYSPQLHMLVGQKPGTYLWKLKSWYSWMLIPFSYICLWVKRLVPIYGSLSHSWYSWMLIPLSYICLLVKSLVPIYGSRSHGWYSWMLIPPSYKCLWVKSLVPIYGSLSHGIHGCLFPSVIYAYGSKAWYLSMVA